ncbi:hypothetical protein R3I94_000412 [Phoxinus phoxinus]
MVGTRERIGSAEHILIRLARCDGEAAMLEHPTQIHQTPLFGRRRRNAGVCVSVLVRENPCVEEICSSF